jgi:hypothetical protein
MFLEAVSHKPAPPTLPDFTLKHFIKPELKKNPYIKARTPQVQLVTRKTVFCRKKRRQKKSLFRGTRELEEARFRGKSCLILTTTVSKKSFLELYSISLDRLVRIRETSNTSQ